MTTQIYSNYDPKNHNEFVNGNKKFFSIVRFAQAKNHKDKIGYEITLGREQIQMEPDQFKAFVNQCKSFIDQVK